MNPYILVVFFAALIGSFFYGHHEGALSTEAKYLAAENKAVEDAQAEVDKARDEIDKERRNTQAAIIALSDTYQKELKANAKLKDDIISGLRAGSVRLRDTGEYALGKDPMPGSGAGRGGRDATAGAELSGATSEFLVSEASRADDVVKQLTACQAVIRENEKLCGPRDKRLP